MDEWQGKYKELIEIVGSPLTIHVNFETINFSFYFKSNTTFKAKCTVAKPYELRKIYLIIF